MIESDEIDRRDHLLDVGCGSGMFLLYLASEGFQNLYGIEMEDYLYKRCVDNVNKMKRVKSFNGQIFFGNALTFDAYDKMNVFYLFNTFYDKATYDEWLDIIENSYLRKKRKIKIIILYPTVSSMGACKGRFWLYEKKRILCKEQACYQCVHFIIYESRDDENENIISFDHK